MTEDTRDLLVIDSGTGARHIRAGDYLDGSADERAATEAHAWIKALRHARVDGQPLRRRFTLRGDSLWWFAELYLHKQQVILEVFRTLAALERLFEEERPLSIGVVSPGRVLRTLVPQAARARNIRSGGPSGFRPGWLRLARMDGRARMLMLAARASRMRARHGVPGGERPVSAAAFVHTAFWRRGASDGSAESYIGQVLETLESRLPGTLRYVGVGPSENFRARRWWHPLRRVAASPAVTPIEALAPLDALRDSARVWRERYAVRRALWDSADLRRHALIRGCDCWTIVREELAGIALLQWPWSARAMDEAGAALDALRPGLALTYAEAGGWGRALMLECRRRGIPTVGLQHGFIHRHWLNYLHEPDEMAPDGDDAGFPRPGLTLLFDEHARHHLEQNGRFPAESLKVTGSPRLDALVSSARALSDDEIARARSAAGADGSRILVVFVAKYREAKHVLPALAEAMSAMPDVQLAIKTHPAETPDEYAAIATGRQNIRVLPASAPLAPLLRASRALITMNSTVAIDAAVLGVPSLVMGLPNNLSPFVDAGLMAGVPAGGAIGPVLSRILYDEGFRLQLERDRSTYLARFGIGSDGRAAVRSADAVLELILGHAPRPATPDRASRRD